MIMVYDIDSLLSELGNPSRAYNQMLDEDGGSDDWGDDAFFPAELMEK